MFATRIARLALVIPLLTACTVMVPPRDSGAPSLPAPQIVLQDRRLASDVVLYSFGLMNTGYRFGGRNPDTGLDCSGMVSYIVEQVTGIRLPHNAEEIARRTRQIGRAGLRPGDLVFFNTLERPYSHMGIYVGDNRFIHAPSRNGRIRVDRLTDSYYARRFEAAHSLFLD